MAKQRPRPTRRGLLPEARRVVLPAGIVSTSAPRIVAVAKACGLALDDWQADIATIMWAKVRDGSLASETVAMSIPRQAGKTYLVAAIVLAYCLCEPGVTVAWTAHHNKVMLETFNSLRAIVARPSIEKRIAKVNASAENRSIAFVNGSRIVMAARESGALRGVANVGVLVLDEAQILTESALSDMLPTQNVARQALTIMLGTPPRPKDPGEVFTQQRDQALRAEQLGEPLDGAAWIEFSADDDAETDDLAQWRKANPSYPKRTPLRAIRKLRRMLSEDHFRREALGIWDDKSTPSVIAPGLWKLRLDAESLAVTKLVLAIDVAPERTHSSVALAGFRADGLPHVELDETRAGTGWVVDWVVQRCEKNQIAAVVVDAKSPASAFVQELQQRLGRRMVVTTNTDDMTNACAEFHDAVVDGELVHIGQPQLTTSLNLARKRSIGDRWAWNRKSADSDITPIVAATLALWGVNSRKVRDRAARKSTGRRVMVL